MADRWKMHTSVLAAPASPSYLTSVPCPPLPSISTELGEQRGVHENALTFIHFQI